MPNNDTYSLVCGMEVHAELKTQSKMFCGCPNDPFHADKPNMYTCPVCLGMPGGLPVPNKKAIEWTIQLGLALNCEINLFSKFDRKHYFYPDLPKGYQISQYDLPFCENGYIETSHGKVRIRRIHLEEDTGKLLHKTVDGKKVSLVDYNRGGVPLIEIVTEPDIKSGEMAKEYGRKLRDIIRFLDIGDCDMEQGGMRLEANISITRDPNQLPDYKVEVKNINSFRFVEQAIGFEMKRQAKILEAGETPAQETRGWDPTKGQTFSQRTKEEAEDYRYFPDPDIPPIRFSEEEVEALRAALPELPNAIVARWHKAYQVEPRYSELLFTTQAEAGWFDDLFAAAVKENVKPNDIANALANKKIALKVTAEPAEALEKYIAETKTEQLDEQTIIDAIARIKLEHPAELERYQAGEEKLLNFFVGQLMRTLKSKVDMGQIRPILQRELQ